MKATGIVRRVDDLGRIVIPKEIRRTLKIREGDPLKIFTNFSGGDKQKRWLRPPFFFGENLHSAGEGEDEKWKKRIVV